VAKALTVQYSPEFLLEVAFLESQGYDLTALTTLTDLLINKQPLPVKYKDHQLKKRLKKFRDAHIDDTLDWILIYRYIGRNIIRFERTGSHEAIFGNWHL
jgi:mRNA interferase YafQ